MLGAGLRDGSSMPLQTRPTIQLAVCGEIVERVKKFIMKEMVYLEK